VTLVRFAGQKIKLGENVVAALRKMRCPSPLQPHQIRGLDFAALFPVFQWLVKHVLATREQRGAQIRRYSELKFKASRVMPTDDEARLQMERCAPFVQVALEPRPSTLNPKPPDGDLRPVCAGCPRPSTLYPKPQDSRWRSAPRLRDF
jgi:hypothetical protein